MPWQLCSDTTSTSGTSFLAERRHILRHARAHFGIRQPPASCGEIVDHGLGLVGARYYSSHRGMGEDELEKELAPASAVEIGRPIGQLTAQSLAKELPASEG